jgi:hypothetical protein
MGMLAAYRAGEAVGRPYTSPARIHDQPNQPRHQRYEDDHPGDARNPLGGQPAGNPKYVAHYQQARCRSYAQFALALRQGQQELP